jgi:hypothetical protein
MSELTVQEPGPIEARTTPTDEQTIICFAALLAALQTNVMSGDIWWLSHNSAKHAVGELGVAPEVYEAVKKKLEEARLARYRPMASMFA